MPKRKLRIVKHDAGGALLGACIRCNKTFEAPRAVVGPARQLDIAKQFDAHSCKPVDSSQNALRIVRESTEGK
jgi:hypothetical protein